MTGRLISDEKYCTRLCERAFGVRVWHGGFAPHGILVYARGVAVDFLRIVFMQSQSHPDKFTRF